MWRLGLVALSCVAQRGSVLLVRRYAPRWGFVDRPGGHKGHRVPTPLGGGVAIWLTIVSILAIGLLAVSAAGPGPSFPSRWRVMSGASSTRSGELVVDSRPGQRDHGHGAGGRSQEPRLAAPAGHSVRLRRCWLAVTGIRVTLFGPFTHPVLGGAVTVLWIVGLTNAFNMLDNMDGLAASVGLIAAALFCGAQVAAGSLFAPAVLLVVVGALAGFLVHNHCAGAAVHGGCREQFPGVSCWVRSRWWARSRATSAGVVIRRTACSRRSWSWRCRFMT